MDEEVKKVMQGQQPSSRFFMPEEFYEKQGSIQEQPLSGDSLSSPVARTIPSFLAQEEGSKEETKIEQSASPLPTKTVSEFQPTISIENGIPPQDSFSMSSSLETPTSFSSTASMENNVPSMDSSNLNWNPPMEEKNAPNFFENTITNVPFKNASTEKNGLSALEQFLSSEEKAPLFSKEQSKDSSFSQPIMESPTIEVGEALDLKSQLFEQHYRDQVNDGILTNPFLNSVEPSRDQQLYKAGSTVDVIKEPYTIDGLFVESGTEGQETTEPEKARSASAIQNWINKILRIPSLDPVRVSVNEASKAKQDPSLDTMHQEETIEKSLVQKSENVENDSIEEAVVEQYKRVVVDYDQDLSSVEVIKSDLVERLRKKSEEDGSISILARYGEDFCSKDFVTNPAIGRSEEIRQLILILLTPEKSGILIGKPGIGKTSIVEGLAYQLQRNHVPDALKGYTIVNVKTASLMGTLPTGETRLQTLVDELKMLDKIILFIDEIHMLIGATNDSALDFANMFKEGLGRGKIKVIGATTTEEYERYVLRDKAFVRRFQKVEVLEPSRDLTVRILMGTLPKLEKETSAKLKYTGFQQSQIMGFIVDITSEYKRIYGIGSRYPDICLTLLAQAFSNAVFENRKEVTIFDVRNAIENSKNIYPDVIRKELPAFDILCKDMIAQEKGENHL